MVEIALAIGILGIALVAIVLIGTCLYVKRRHQHIQRPPTMASCEDLGGASQSSMVDIPTDVAASAKPVPPPPSNAEWRMHGTRIDTI